MFLCVSCDLLINRPCSHLSQASVVDLSKKMNDVCLSLFLLRMAILIVVQSRLRKVTILLETFKQSSRNFLSAEVVTTTRWDKRMQCKNRPKHITSTPTMSHLRRSENKCGSSSDGATTSTETLSRRSKWCPVSPTSSTI